METFAHLALKRMAVDFARRDGCLAVATEVRCPISRYRVDVAAYRDGGPPPRPRRPRRAAGTILIECKQSRSDFFRDHQRLERIIALRDGLERLRVALETRIRREEPDLRVGEGGLFDEFDEWDYERTGIAAYTRVLERLKKVERRLYGQTKFQRFARYRLADHLYLAAPRGMIRPAEVPPGWGLLECPKQWLTAESLEGRDPEAPRLTIRCPAPQHTAPDRHRQRLLRNIAVAATADRYGRASSVQG